MATLLHTARRWWPTSRLAARALGGRPTAPARAQQAASHSARTALDVAQRLLSGKLAEAEGVSARTWLRDAAEGLSEEELRTLATPELAQLLGACSRARPVDTKLFLRASKVLGDPARLQAVDAKTGVHIASAYGNSRVPAHVLLDRLAKRLCPPPPASDADPAPASPPPAGQCPSLLLDCSPGELVSLVIAYSKVENHTPALFEAVSRTLAPQLSRLRTSDLVWLAHALGSSGYAHLPQASLLMRTLSERIAAPGVSAAISPNQLCVLAHAYVRACEPESRARVLGMAVARLERIASSAPAAVARPLAQLDARSLAILVWGLGISGHGTEPSAQPLLHALVAEARLRGKGLFSRDELDQLERAVATLNLEEPSLGLALGWSSAQLQPGRRYRTGLNMTVSQEKLASALRASGIAHTCEHTVEGTPFIVDVAVPQSKVAIEVHGLHSHVHRRAADECKARVLHKLGWHVEVVGARKWEHYVEEGLFGKLCELVRARQPGRLPAAQRFSPADRKHE
jgi:very-short-patch-repair endonuclease